MHPLDLYALFYPLLSMQVYCSSNILLYPTSFPPCYQCNFYPKSKHTFFYTSRYPLVYWLLSIATLFEFSIPTLSNDYPSLPFSPKYPPMALLMALIKVTYKLCVKPMVGSQLPFYLTFWTEFICSCLGFQDNPFCWFSSYDPNGSSSFFSASSSSSSSSPNVGISWGSVSFLFSHSHLCLLPW